MEWQNWHRLTANPQAIERLYAISPRLTLLRRLSLDRDGPTLRISAQLSDLPTHPPARWPVGVVSAFVDLDFAGLRTILVGPLGSGTLQRVGLERVNGLVSFELSGDGLRVSGTCLACYIQRVAVA